MSGEELFLAIGQVESSRLLRSELTVQAPSGDGAMEGHAMQKKRINGKRIIRNILVAAVIVSMLAVTAYAVGGFLIYDSPEEMLTAIFGDETGFDHSDGGAKYFDDGALAAIEPTFDRVPADETVVAENIAPHVNAVGQSIQFNGYTLTVDAFMYDSTTRCGFVTYLLENPDGLPNYKVQPNGEIWIEGAPDVVDMNQMPESYIIQDKSTETCLAATAYFKATEGDTLEITLESQQRYTPDEFEALIAEDVERLKQKITPEEAVEAVRQQLGDEHFAIFSAGVTDEELIEICYSNIVAQETAERLEREGTSEAIVIPLNENQALAHITAGKESVIVTPISIKIDITNLDFLHTNHRGEHWINTDNIDSVIIRYKDGTEYTVIDGYILNCTFNLSELPEENVMTEIYVSPEEDPAGEGYFDVRNSHNYCLLTMIFNRIIDIEAVDAVVLNGTELPLD